MDVIIMHSTISLISQLKTDYPQFLFKKSDCFLWSPSENTIYYADQDKDYCIFLLHELSHALLEHADYDHDIELVAMEREAWDKAIDLASTYQVVVDKKIVQSTLDTYRDWLHERSTCPNCNATGIQIEERTYRCIACSHEWQVNEARICALRRYKINK
jgi:hypothetical protein